MDKIIIRNLEFYAAVGVSDAERDVGQRLLVNMEVGYNLRVAGRSDRLDDTVSYSEVARTVQSIGMEGQCKLLEFMAERMVEEILARFPVEDVRLQLLKKPPPTNLMIEAAGVEIYRRRQNSS